MSDDKKRAGFPKPTKGSRGDIANAQRARRCDAMTRHGNPCKSAAMRGEKFCYKHIAMHRPDRAPPPPASKPIIAEGDLMLKLKDAADQKLLKFVIQKLKKDFHLNDSSDRMQMEAAAYYYVKWRRAVEKDEEERAAQYDALIQRNLSALQVTRTSRPADVLDGSTPADWASELVARADKLEKKKLREEKGVKRKKKVAEQSGGGEVSD